MNKYLLNLSRGEKISGIVVGTIAFIGGSVTFSQFIESSDQVQKYFIKRRLLAMKFPKPEHMSSVSITPFSSLFSCF